MNKIIVSAFLSLLAANAFAYETYDSAKTARARAADSIWVDSVCPGRARVCLDSLSQALAVRLRAATANAGEKYEAYDSENEERDDRLALYVLNFASDVTKGKSKKSTESSGGSSSTNYKDLGAAVLVVAGVVVIGAVIIGVPYFTYHLFKGDEDLPAYRELSLRYAYTGSSWDGGGSPLYRNTQLASARFTLGLRRPHVGLGLTVDGGYLNAHLEDLAGSPGRTFNKGGPFFLIGPSLQVGPERLHVDVDFLNGADFVNGAGWMTEGRFSLRGKVSKHILLGGYIGGLFYDMRFFDGLVWRRGSFNRDVTLMAGVETGLAF